MITIQKVTAEDIPEVKKLLSDTWKDTYGSFLSEKTIEKVTTIWHSPESLKAQTEDPDTYFSIAKDEKNKILGLITIKKLDEQTAHMGRLYVRPTAQRQGIGSKLFIAAQIENPHIKIIRLEVEEENKKALSFYHKLGFKNREKKTEDIEGEQLKCIVMEKIL